MVLKISRLTKSHLVSGLVLALGLASGNAAAQTGKPCKEQPLNVNPLGHSVHSFMEVQTANAVQSRFVFLPNEWYMGGCELGPMGCQHMLAVVHATGPCLPIVIETSGNQSLDESRRAHLVKGLETLGLFDAGQRVVVNFPAATVLRGEQAEMTYQSWLLSGRNDWNHGYYPGLGGAGYLGGPGMWGQGYWGLGIGGGYGYTGLLGMPWRN
jgi:hypothetical protein